MKPPAGPYRIKVLEKALGVLELFDEMGASLTLTEIGRRLGLSKATAFRIATALADAGYLERDREGNGYRLGYELFRLGALVEGLGDLQRRARPFLEALKQKLDETVHLVVLSRGEALYLDKIEGKKTVRVVSRVGMTLPAHCSGVGKVLLAHLPEAEVDAIVREKGLQRFTVNTITEREALLLELRRVRQRGYALDNEEIEEGLKCIAAPIRDATGRVVAAVSISGPRFRFDAGATEELAAELLKTAEGVSRALGAEPRRRQENGRSRHARNDGAQRRALAGGRG
jgi:DNA-binding IclR family transcriptional regulator